jgi:CCR4-NOT complex subunit CAF16
MGENAMVGATAAIEITGMSYTWKDGTPALMDVNLALPAGCRSIIVGANGAGKTCMLRCIGGMYKYEGTVKVQNAESYVVNRLGNSGSVEVICGTNIWRKGNCTIVGERWQPNGNSSVATMLSLLEGWSEERRDYLIHKFGIDLDWRVNQLSDGKKRRVQLLLAFIKPSELLLLDEVTTDLDVLARQSLLEFLKEENETHGVTVLFSTHIFDGLEEWGTHVTYVRNGTVVLNKQLSDMAELEPFKAAGCLTPLFNYVEATVRKDAQQARAAGRKSTRGQYAQAFVPVSVAN